MKIIKTTEIERTVRHNKKTIERHFYGNVVSKQEKNSKTNS